MVELCPAPWTTEATMTHARRVLLSVGQQPVTMTRELEGFIAIRTQNAIIMEAMRLVLVSASCRDFSCIRSHSTPECDEAFSTYLSTPLHATPMFRPLP